MGVVCQKQHQGFQNTPSQAMGARNTKLIVDVKKQKI